MILEALEVKFGAAAAREFASAVNTTTNTERLARLQRLALRSSDLEQFWRRFQKA